MSVARADEYPCYGHSCYDRGNYHVTCTQCHLFKTVRKESDRIDQSMTDEQYAVYLSEKLSEPPEHTVYTLDREICSYQKNPNTGIIYDNLDDVLRNHLITFGNLPIIGSDSASSITPFIDLQDVIGFVVSFTSDTVDIELTALGENYRNNRLFDNKKIQFCFVVSGNKVVKILYAKVVAHE